MTTNAAPASASTPASTPTDSGATNTDPAQPGQSAVKTQEKPIAPEMFEIKVNGKMKKMTRDEMLARASQADAAEERFGEASKLRKQAEGVIGRLKDPEQVMDALLDPALGYTKEQIREKFETWYEREFIEPEKLTKDQRELREAKARLDKYAEDDKKRAAAKLAAEDEARTDTARTQIQGQIIEALETGSLPKTNFTVRRLAYWINRNNENGFNAPTSLLVSQVKNEFNSSMRDMVEASDGETLIQLLGDSIVQKIRKYDLEQLKKMRAGGTPPAPTQGGGTPPADRGKKITSAEATQRLRQLQRTGRF